MKSILLYLLFLGQLSLLAQNNCPYYQKYIEKGDQAAKAARYEEALDAYNIAMLHCPERQAEAQARILVVFRAIETLKKEAETARNKSEYQKKRILQQQDSLTVALYRAREMKELANSFLEQMLTQNDTLKTVLTKLEKANQVKDSVNTQHLRLINALIFL